MNSGSNEDSDCVDLYSNSGIRLRLIPFSSLNQSSIDDEIKMFILLDIFTSNSKQAKGCKRSFVDDESCSLVMTLVCFCSNFVILS